MANGHAALPADLASELMDTDPFDIGLDHNEPAPDENRRETSYEEIMGIDVDAVRGGGPNAVGDRLVAFREWLSNDAKVIVHPYVCIVNGLATDGTKNAPVLMTAASPTISSDANNSLKGSATQASGRCGVVDGDLDRALYDRTMGCQLRASREIRKDEVLLSVIEHWNILQNTSVEGLRQSFLQRNGKLSYNGSEWLLQVEQQPYDMLLQHLPWNISMIKLPWMEQMLKTEWIH